ncbi:hypothetical protein AVEN_91039-1 [Araneus ventricosus]|uniref:Uncharacterized protein n=1 Tax=Araneus ventricosus TaxID=182803 RepID=A0A4Y2P364_ARAVE|nr:hypothetical protein AVEN_91039-1 [Araneus ventricosus]
MDFSKQGQIAVIQFLLADGVGEIGIYRRMCMILRVSLELQFSIRTVELTLMALTLSIREHPKHLFKQKTMAIRNVRISLRNFHLLSLNVLDFSPAARAFFVSVARPDGSGEKGCFLRIRTVPAVSEFPLSLKEELGRSRILRSLCSNGLRNQKVKHD